MCPARSLWWLVGFTAIVLALFVSTFPTHFLIADEVAYFEQALEWHHPTPPSTVSRPPSPYPPGTALVAAAWMFFFGPKAVFWSSMVAWLVGIWALALLLRRIEKPVVWALYPALFLPGLVLTRTVMSDLPSFALASLFLGLFAGHPNSRSASIGAGLLAGLGLLFRETNVLWALPFLAGAVWRRQAFWPLLWAGFGIGLVPRLLWGWTVAGDPFFVRDPGVAFSWVFLPKNLLFYALALLVLAPGGLYFLHRATRLPYPGKPPGRTAEPRSALSRSAISTTAPNGVRRYATSATAPNEVRRYAISATAPNGVRRYAISPAAPNGVRRYLVEIAATVVLYLAVYGCYGYDALAKSGYKGVVLQGRFLLPLLPCLTIAAAYAVPAVGRRWAIGIGSAALLAFAGVQWAGHVHNTGQQRLTNALLRLPTQTHLTCTPDESRKYLNALHGPQRLLPLPTQNLFVTPEGSQTQNSKLKTQNCFPHLITRTDSADWEKKNAEAEAAFERYFRGWETVLVCDISLRDGTRLRVWQAQKTSTQ